jgi:hypothetical protein
MMLTRSRRGQRRDRTPIACLIAVALAAGCGRAPAPPTASPPDGAETASVRFAVSGAALDAIARVTVIVAQGDGPDFPSFEVELSEAGGGWAGFATGIPAGPGRQFDVLAEDAYGKPLFAASARMDVGAGGVADLAVALQPTAPPSPWTDSAPVLDLLSVSSIEVWPAGQVRLGAAAHAPDPGRQVSYEWSASCLRAPTCQMPGSCGAYDDASSPAPTWTAPASSDSCRLSLTMQDGGSFSVTVTLAIEVSTSAPPW